MARITVEDCLVNESNRFALVRLASRRAKQLLSGKSPVTDTKGNKAIVSALREIADGKVRFKRQEDEALETIEASDGYSSPSHLDEQGSN
jgi:DNA-directed RNA polymerase subunit omega